METGIEHILSRWAEWDLGLLRTVQPQIVKVRHPELVAPALAAYPGTKILARNPGEGDQPGDVFNGYQRWLPVLSRFAESIVGYEPANEPNDKLFVDPFWWAREVTPLFHSGSPVPLISPGLIRYQKRTPWEDALRTLPWDYIGKHIYWQQDGPQAAIDDVLGDVAASDYGRVIVTEINAGDARPEYNPALEVRAEQTAAAFEQLARLGVHSAVLFCLTPWQHNWGYSYPMFTAASILARGRQVVAPAEPAPEPEPEPEPTPEPTPVEADVYPISPHYGGPRPATVGVVIHSTRGGAAYGTEFRATLNWFANPASLVSAHAVVSRTGEVAYPVAADLIAWHAREHNQSWLGIEFEQPTLHDDFPVEQLLAGAAVVRDWCAQYGLPVDREHLRGHEEMPAGRADGKTDPGPEFPWDRFLALVQGEVAEEPAGDPVLAYIDAVYGNLREANEQIEEARTELLRLKAVLGY